MDRLDIQSLRVFGLSHERAAVALREQIAIDRSSQLETLSSLRKVLGYAPVLLSTCNRTELYFVGEGEELVKDFFFSRISSEDVRQEVREKSFLKTGEGALQHLFRVASGLSSQLIGENEILGQIKRAFELAKTEDSRSELLDAAFEHAIRLGKRARSHTGISAGSLSLASLAVQKLFLESNPRAVAVIGTGETAELMLQELRRFDVPRVHVFSHAIDQARKVAGKFSFEAQSITRLSAVLPETEALLCATSAPHPVVDSAAFGDWLDEKNEEYLIADLGLPRNVDSSVETLDGVRVYGLDDLKAVADEKIQQRRKYIPLVEKMVAESEEVFTRWLKKRQATPFIQALREQAEGVRQEQLDWIRKRLPELGQREELLLEQFSRRLVNTLLSAPLGTIDAMPEDADLQRFLWQFCGVENQEEDTEPAPGKGSLIH